MVLSFVLVSLFANAAGPGVPQSKYRLECAIQSEKWAANLPEKNVNVWCASPTWKDLRPVGPDILHAMVVGAFRDLRKDRRANAIAHLESYECADLKACREFHSLLDWGVKSSGPHDRSAIKIRGEKLRASTAEKIAQLIPER